MIENQAIKNLFNKDCIFKNGIPFFLVDGKEVALSDSEKKQFITEVENLKLEEQKERDVALTKTEKAKELRELTIDINTVFYDAHQEAIGNMAAVVAIATAKFQKAISVGIVKEGDTEPTLMDNAQAYQYVYKDQKVTWKGADNKPHVVQVESLVEASEKAMTAKAVILFKY